MKREALRALLEELASRSSAPFIAFRYCIRDDPPKTGTLEEVLDGIPEELDRGVRVWGLFEENLAYGTYLVLLPDRGHLWCHSVLLRTEELKKFLSGDRRHLIWGSGHRDPLKEGDVVAVSARDVEQTHVACVTAVSDVPAEWCATPLQAATLAPVFHIPSLVGSYPEGEEPF